MINSEYVYARYNFSSADILIGASIVASSRARMRIPSIIGALWLSIAVPNVCEISWRPGIRKRVHGVSIYWNKIFEDKRSICQKIRGLISMSKMNICEYFERYHLQIEYKTSILSSYFLSHCSCMVGYRWYEHCSICYFCGDGTVKEGR